MPAISMMNHNCTGHQVPVPLLTQLKFPHPWSAVTLLQNLLTLRARVLNPRGTLLEDLKRQQIAMMTVTH